MTGPRDDDPEARLKATPAQQRQGSEPEDLLKVSEEQIRRRESAADQDDTQPESRLEALPEDQRKGQDAADLLKAPADPGE